MFPSWGFFTMMIISMEQAQVIEISWSYQQYRSRCHYPLPFVSCSLLSWNEKKRSTIINRWLLLPKEKNKILPQALLNFPISLMCNTRHTFSLPTQCALFYFDGFVYRQQNEKKKRDSKQFPFDFLFLAAAATFQQTTTRSRNKLLPNHNFLWWFGCGRKIGKCFIAEFVSYYCAVFRFPN